MLSCGCCIRDSRWIGPIAWIAWTCRACVHGSIQYTASPWDEGWGLTRLLTYLATGLDGWTTASMYHARAHVSCRDVRQLYRTTQYITWPGDLETLKSGDR